MSSSISDKDASLLPVYHHYDTTGARTQDAEHDTLETEEDVKGPRKCCGITLASIWKVLRVILIVIAVIFAIPLALLGAIYLLHLLYIAVLWLWAGLVWLFHCLPLPNPPA